MKTKMFITLIIFFLLSSISLFSETLDFSSPEAIKNTYEKLMKSYKEGDNSEDVLVGLAEACYEYGEFVAKESKEKLKWFEEGKKWASIATNKYPKSARAYFFFGKNLGKWAETRGVMESLFTVGDLLNSAEMAIKLDPKFVSAYNLRGRIYQKAPGWPVSVGDKKKALENFLKALEIDPNNRATHYFLAELLLDENKKTEAEKHIQKVLSIPIDNSKKLEELEYINLAKELAKRYKIKLESSE